ncbi:hypothetical protein EB796_019215 [Bugula neritina]|uniref:Uncharacterized protein n=1 Tax=Bugula neritina TaxID=10212 RepID=A0A7J7J8D3_BUGNE|nr:hypothetical protein EB796_019215 [Bugula neritina]
MTLAMVTSGKCWRNLFGFERCKNQLGSSYENTNYNWSKLKADKKQSAASLRVFSRRNTLQHLSCRQFNKQSCINPGDGLTNEQKLIFETAKDFATNEMGPKMKL